MTPDHFAASPALGQGGQLRKGPRREEDRRPRPALPGGPPDGARRAGRAQSQGSHRLPAEQGLVGGAEQAPRQRRRLRPGQGFEAQADGVAAVRLAVEDRFDPLLPAEGRGGGVPRDHHPAEENAAGGVQGILEQRPAPQPGQELAAPEPPPHARGHDHASQPPEGGVQVHAENVRPPAQLLQEGQLLLADRQQHPLALHQGQQGLAVGRAGRFQIAHLVHRGPLPRRRGGPGQRPGPQRAEGFFHRAHPVFRAGQAGVEPPHRGLLAREVVPEPDRLPRLGPGGNAGQRPVRQAGRQRLQPGALAAAPAPCQDQMASTAALERSPDTAGVRPRHRRRGKLHSAGATPFLPGSGCCPRRPGRRRCGWSGQSPAPPRRGAPA